MVLDLISWLLLRTKKNHNTWNRALLTSTMMNSIAVIISLILAPSAAQVLKMDFVPAASYQQVLHRVHDKLFFMPTLPDTVDDGCWQQCIESVCEPICGGNFRLDLSNYVAVEFKFDFGTDTLLRPSVRDPRIRVAFYAQAVDCTNGELFLNKFVKGDRIHYEGSGFEDLKNNFDQKKSFAQITRCSIATKLEFSPTDEASHIEANVTSMSWKVALDNPDFQMFPEQEYYFDTSMPSWIEVPSDITNEPTQSPTTAPVHMTPEPTIIVLSREMPTASPSLISSAIGTLVTLVMIVLPPVLTLMAIIA